PLDSLARVSFELGQYEDDRRYHGECLAVAQELGDKVNTVDALDGFTRLAVVSERPELALTIAGAAHAIRDRIGYATPKPWRRRLDKSIGAARAALNLQAATAAWDRGLKLTEQEAVLLALSDLSLPLATPPSPLADSSLPLVGRVGEGVVT